MNIYAKPGTKVTPLWMNLNGYPFDREHAAEYLSKEKIYTVNRMQVHNWSSSVELKEHRNVWFNTVLFSEVN